MLQTLLFISLLFVHDTTQSDPATQADCNEDVSLGCPGIDTMDFISVTWYKFEGRMRLGIIRKGKADEPPQKYNFSREVSFGEKYSLLLPSVTPADSGRYECAVNANVGGKNQNLKVNLVVHECVTQAELTTMTNVLNTTQPNLLCNKQVQDLPVMWSTIGYVSVALVKILAALICIWVIHIRSSRQQQDRWCS